jgi:hypothetical protein
MITDIKHKKAIILAALYNNAMCPGAMALFAFEPGHVMTETEAQKIIDDLPADRLYFDYLKGRVMKINLSPVTLEALDFRLYDRDNGIGAGYNTALEALTKP